MLKNNNPERMKEHASSGMQELNGLKNKTERNEKPMSPKEMADAAMKRLKESKQPLSVMVPFMKDTADKLEASSKRILAAEDSTPQDKMEAMRAEDRVLTALLDMERADPKSAA